MLLPGVEILHDDDAVLEFTTENDRASGPMLAGFLEQLAHVAGALVGATCVESMLPQSRQHWNHLLGSTIIGADDECIRSWKKRFGVQQSTILKNQ